MPNFLKSKKELTVKISVSPLQWGEKPGNLRFSIYITSERIPVGALSIGGTAAYKLQEKILHEGPLAAHVLCGGSTNRIVLTQLLADDGWMDWQEVVLGSSGKQTPRILVDQVVMPAIPASRMSPAKKQSGVAI